MFRNMYLRAESNRQEEEGGWMDGKEKRQTNRGWWGGKKGTQKRWVGGWM